MGQHTTDDVYGQLKEVQEQLDKNAAQAVIKPHFDSKIAELKTAIEKAGKKEKEDEKKSGWDVIKEQEPIKSLLGVIKGFTEIAKGEGILAKVVMGLIAVSGAVAVFGKVRTMVTDMIARIKGALNTFKNFTLAATSRLRGERQYLGRDDTGRFGLRPEQTAGERQQAVQAGQRQARRSGRSRGASRLPNAGDGVHDLGRDLEKVNSELETFGRLKSKLPKARTLKGISDAAKDLHRNGDNLKTMFRELASASTGAADAIGGGGR
ncbi:hypothetical protein ACIREE_07635 [Streptomyces sp. NPDC102467]|uniref:hypothetical protein n=1 Tax=Streptomyces sp. NPDC102467 TaxID=3366179 RepID=UPI0038073366